MRILFTPEWTTLLYGVAILFLLVVVLGLRRLAGRRAADRAIRDPLTGAYTPDFIQEIYQAELRRAERTGVPFSVALVTLHDPAGTLRQQPAPQADQISLAMAKWLKENLRGSDYIGRLDEYRFALILPETWEEDARMVVDRINGSFRYQPRRNGSEVWLSCDVGIATWKPEDPDAWDGASKQLQRLAGALKN